MLCQLASKATRRFHKPNTRIQETMNQVFDKIADAERHDILSEPEYIAEAQRGAAYAAPPCARTAAEQSSPARENENPSRKIIHVGKYDHC